MNIIYETTKERGTTILIPTSMVDTMNIAVPLAMTARLDQPSAKRERRPHRRRRRA